MTHTGLTIKQVGYTFSSNLNSARAWAQTLQLNYASHSIVKAVPASVLAEETSIISDNSWDLEQARVYFR